MMLRFVDYDDIKTNEVTGKKFLGDCLKGSSPNYLYRGHADIGWDLIPSAFRKSGVCVPLAERQIRLNYYTSEQFELLFENLYSSTELTDSIKLKESEYRRLQMLCYCQHMGLPTPVLDWSYSPLVALFIACRFGRAAVGKVRIWRLDQSITPNVMPVQTFKSLGFNRVKSQMGALTFFGNVDAGKISFSPITVKDHYDAYPKAKFINKIDVDLSGNNKKEVLDALESNGFTFDNLFPRNSYYASISLRDGLPFEAS